MTPIAERFSRHEPRDRAAWRRWLEQHHASSTGILLVYVKGAARSLTYAAAVEEALCFGWIDSTLLPIDEARYMQLFTPRKPKSGWSAVNKARAAAMIEAGLMTAAGQAKIDAAKRDGSWAALDHVENLTLPPAFARALDRNRRAREHFESLPRGARKIFLYWINNVKREAARAERIALAIGRLARGARHPRQDAPPRPRAPRPKR